MKDKVYDKHGNRKIGTLQDGDVIQANDEEIKVSAPSSDEPRPSHYHHDEDGNKYWCNERCTIDIPIGVLLDLTKE